MNFQMLVTLKKFQFFISYKRFIQKFWKVNERWNFNAFLHTKKNHCSLYKLSFWEKWHHIPRKAPYKRGCSHQIFNFVLTSVIKMGFFISRTLWRDHLYTLGKNNSVLKSTDVKSHYCEMRIAYSDNTKSSWWRDNAATPFVCANANAATIFERANANVVTTFGWANSNAATTNNEILQERRMKIEMLSFC
jgi:hypothetical protein